MSNIIKSGGNSRGFSPFSFPSHEEYFKSDQDAQATESGDGAPGADLDGEGKAQEILSKAKKQAESLRTEAFELGYKEGMSEGRTEAAGQLESAVGSLREAHQQIVDMQQRIHKDSESEMVELALELARKVIGAELSHDPSTVVKVIQTALGRVSAAKVISIRVNPSDLGVLKDAAPDFLNEIQVVGDPEVSRGGAVIESSSGNLDAQMEVQLAEIEKKLKRGVVEADEAAG